MGRTPKTRENLSSYIQENNYIQSLIEIFRVAEQAEDLDTLHALCNCMQTIRTSYNTAESLLKFWTYFEVVLNEHQMYEHILSDDIWMGVVGILECEYLLSAYTKRAKAKSSF